MSATITEEKSSSSAFYRLEQRARTTGMLANRKRKRSHPATNPDLEAHVLDIVHVEPNVSVREIEKNCQISRA